MFGLESLDVLIGLVTLYLAFGIAATAAVEAISSWFGLRSKNLESALGEFLDGDLARGERLVDAFYRHPLVQVLSKGRNGRPSYIPPEIVSQVVERLLLDDYEGKSLSKAISDMPGAVPGENRIKQILLGIEKEAAGDIEKFRETLEKHFDFTMDRAVGWFKRRTQYIAIVVSAVLVVGANLDTVEIARALAANPEARSKLVGVAEGFIADQAPADRAGDGGKVAQAEATAGEVGEETGAPAEDAGEQAESVDNPAPVPVTPPAAEEQARDSGDPAVAEARKLTREARTAVLKALSDMDASGVRVGWESVPQTFGGWLSKLAGLLVSILAVSLGAPFWFNVLQHIMQLRAAGAPPAKLKS